MAQLEHQGRNRSGAYGSFAWGSVVLSCYAGYFYTHHFFGPAWLVLVTFALGALSVVLALLGGRVVEDRGAAWRACYFVVQCALMTLIIFLSPLRGIFGIIVLPLAAEAIFELRPRGAALVALYLFAIDVLVWYIPDGWNAVVEAVISYSAGFAFTIAFTIITKRALDARLREERLRREIETANAQLREHAAQAEELATTRERNRLAREIHDGVGHYLTVVKTQLDAAAALIAIQPDQARVAVEKAAKLTHEALEDVRRSVGTLRTDIVRPPLADSLRQLAANADPLPEILITGTPRELSASAEHTLFRATQEALTNIRKHAQATAASVTLDFREPARVRLVITDNGRGLSEETARRCKLNGSSGGYGLRGLRERVEIIGGRLETGPQSGGGFALRIEVPA